GLNAASLLADGPQHCNIAPKGRCRGAQRRYKLDEKLTGVILARTLAPVFSLLLAPSILLIGNGLPRTLIPLRAGMQHVSPAMIGGIGRVYVAGFLAGCVLGHHIVRRAGHMRSFAA